MVGMIAQFAQSNAYNLAHNPLWQEGGVANSYAATPQQQQMQSMAQRTNELIAQGNALIAAGQTGANAQAGTLQQQYAGVNPLGALSQHYLDQLLATTQKTLELYKARLAAKGMAPVQNTAVTRETKANEATKNTSSISLKDLGPVHIPKGASMEQRRLILRPYIQQLSKKHGVDPKFVEALIQQESAFKPDAKSHAGAMGLMQLMPDTAKDLGVKNAWDPIQNMDGGIRYIAEQLKRFGGDKSLALAAYNAGPGAVQKHGGIPPYKETQNYVRIITNNYAQLA